MRFVCREILHNRPLAAAHRNAALVRELRALRFGDLSGRPRRSQLGRGGRARRFWENGLALMMASAVPGAIGLRSAGSSGRGYFSRTCSHWSPDGSTGLTRTRLARQPHVPAATMAKPTAIASDDPGDLRAAIVQPPGASSGTAFSLPLPPCPDSAGRWRGSPRGPFVRPTGAVLSAVSASPASGSAAVTR